MKVQTPFSNLNGATLNKIARLVRRSPILVVFGLVVLVAVCALVVAAGKAPAVTINQPATYAAMEAPTPEVTRFAVIGDFGCGCQAELDVSNLVKSWNPEFIITTGDNNYDFGEASTIDANIGQYYHDFIYPYVGSYGAGADTNRFFPSLGNHDWGDGYIQPPATAVQPYLDYFTLPGNERY